MDIVCLGLCCCATGYKIAVAERKQRLTLTFRRWLEIVIGEQPRINRGRCRRPGLYTSPRNEGIKAMDIGLGRTPGGTSRELIPNL